MGDRGDLERRGLRPFTGLSLLTGTVLQSLLGREDTPRHSASRRPDTNVHLGPQATGCHHLSSCPTGEVGTSGGHWSELWDDPPQSSAPCWVSRGRSLWPPRHPRQPPSRGSRPPQPASSGARDFSCLLCSLHSSKGAHSPSPSSKPSLNLPSRELPAGQLRQLRRWIRAGFT